MNTTEQAKLGKLLKELATAPNLKESNRISEEIKKQVHESSAPSGQE